MPTATICPSMLPSKTPTPRTSRRTAHPAGADVLTRLDTRIDSLGYALRRAQVRSYEMFYEWLGETGLSPARVTALSIIASKPDTNQAALARQLGISGPSALKLVDALEASGLICRLDVANDRRRYALVLTDTGRSRMEQVKTRLDAYEQRLAQGLNASERKQLLALLERVAR